MKSHFDEAAKTWDLKPDRLERAQKFAGEIIRLTAKRKYTSAMEFGAGTGAVSFCLKDHFSNIMMIDDSEGMVEAMKRKIESSCISSMKAAKINLMADDYKAKHDIIYSLLVLHHIHDIPAILKKFYDILNPGGLLVIGDLVTEDGSFHDGLHEFEGHKGFDTDALSETMNGLGYMYIQSEIFYQIKKEIKNAEKIFPLFLLNGEKDSGF